MIWYWKYCSNVKYFLYIFEWVFMIWCFPDLDLQIIRYCFQDLFKNLFPPLFLSLPCCPSLVVHRSSPSLVPPLILSLPCCSNYSCLHPSHLTQLRSAAFGHLAKYKQTQIKINQSQIAFLTKLRQGYHVLESRPWKLWKYCLGRSDNLSWCKFFFFWLYKIQQTIYQSVQRRFLILQIYICFLRWHFLLKIQFFRHFANLLFLPLTISASLLSWSYIHKCIQFWGPESANCANLWWSWWGRSQDLKKKINSLEN